MGKIEKVLFFPNGNTCAFNEAGKQIPEFQISWFKLYLDFLKAKGIDPIKIEFTMPDARLAFPFEIEDGYNWSMDKPYTKYGS